MTQLIVTPINLQAAGSYGERKKFLRLMRRLQAIKGQQDAEVVLAILDEADELLCSRLRTDDGTPVEAVLEQLSASQFDQLLSAISFESGVGEGSRPSSTAGPEATATSTPTG